MEINVGDVLYKCHFVKVKDVCNVKVIRYVVDDIIVNDTDENDITVFIKNNTSLEDYLMHYIDVFYGKTIDEAFDKAIKNKQYIADSFRAHAESLRKRIEKKQRVSDILQAEADFLREQKEEWRQTNGAKIY